MNTDLVYALFKNGALSLSETVEQADKRLANFDADDSEADFELFESLVSLSLLEEERYPCALEDGDFSLGLIEHFAVRVCYLDCENKDRVKEFNDWVMGRASQSCELEKEIGIYGYWLSEDYPPTEKQIQKEIKIFKTNYKNLSDEIYSKIT